MITIRTLGTLGAAGAIGQDGPALVRRQKPFALLVYLLLAKDPEAYHQRETLCALFWPDSPRDRARASLRQALAAIGHHLGAVIERRGTGELRIEPGRILLDTREFMEAIDRCDWLEAVRTYAGPFLEGFHIPRAPGFERWQDTLQLRLNHSYRHALKQLASDENGSSGTLARSALWIELSEMAPYDAGVALSLARVLESAGSRQEAVTVLESYLRTLKGETSLVPSPKALSVLAGLRENGSNRGVDIEPVSRSGNQSRTNEADGRERGHATGARGWRWVTERRLRRWMAAATCAIALGLAGWFFPRAWGGGSSIGILVAPVAVAAGAEVDATPHALALALGGPITEIDSVRVVPYHDVLGIVDADPEQGWDSQTALELARRFEADLAVRSTVLQSRTGTWEVLVDLVDASDGQSVGPPILVTSEQADLTVLIREAGQRLATRLLEMFAPFPGPRGVLGQSPSPPPLPAYLALADALSAFSAGNSALAEEHARLALRYAPDFTSAHIEVAIQRANRGAPEEADSIARRVRSSGMELGAWDRNRLAWLEAALRGDRVARLDIVRGRRHSNPTYQLAWELTGLGRTRESIEVLDDRAERVDAGFGWRERWLQVVNHHVLGDHASELAIARRYSEVEPERSQPLRLEARALAAAGRLEELGPLLASAAQSFPQEPQLPARVAHEVGRELVSHGWLEEGNLWLDRAIDLYSRAPGSRTAGAEFAGMLYTAQRWEEAEVVYRQLLTNQSDDIGILGSLAVIAARTGRHEEAEAAFRALDGRRPFVYGDRAIWQARIAAAMERDDKVLPLLELAVERGAARPGWMHVNPEWRFLRDRDALDRWLAVEGG